MLCVLLLYSFLSFCSQQCQRAEEVLLAFTELACHETIATQFEKLGDAFFNFFDGTVRDQGFAGSRYFVITDCSFAIQCGVLLAESGEPARANKIGSGF